MAAPTACVILTTMWRRILRLEEQTRAEKRAQLNGISLFFGALIGANLGSLERLPLNEYLLIVTVVCIIAIYIQVAPVARKRSSTIAALAGTVAGLYLLLVSPISERVFDHGIRPGPHLFFTIALWLVSVVMVELRPLVDEHRPADPDLPDE